MRGASRWRAAAAALPVPLALVVAWEAAGRAGLVPPHFFPRPSTVAAHLAALVADGTLPGHAATTLVRLAWTFAAAAGPGVLVGLLMGVSRVARRGLEPVFAALFPIPSVLFLPLLSFATPSAEVALVLTSAVTPFFLVAYTTLTGVRQLDPAVLEAAAHYGARGTALLAKVLLPGTLPAIFTGLRLGLGYALIVVIAVEMASAQRGLGALLWLSWQILKVEDMYAALVAIAALGALLGWALALVRARLLPWARDAAEAA